MAQISKIREVVGSLARNIVTKACKRFRSRIEDIVDADDSFIEQMDSQYVFLPTCF
jgi:hypothetical protein